MSDTTARLALPLLAAGQAQKELFHNEALARVDMALHPLVQGVGVDDPPATPAVGACWIVGAAPTSAWAGQTDALAAWTDGGWRFVAPILGLTAWRADIGLPVRYDGAAWVSGEIVASRLVIAGTQVVGMQQSKINPPNGGTIIDIETRTCLANLLDALTVHGLLAP